MWALNKKHTKRQRGSDRFNGLSAQCYELMSTWNMVKVISINTLVN